MNKRNLELGLARNRVRRRIQAYLDAIGMNMADVARALDVHRSLVAATVAGGNHNRRVLAKLRELGVPERLLFDPSLEENKEGAAA